jgi:hypothetical protein
MANAPFAAGKKVSSTYFLAHANRDLFSPPFVDLTPKALAS